LALLTDLNQAEDISPAEVLRLFRTHCQLKQHGGEKKGNEEL